MAATLLIILTAEPANSALRTASAETIADRPSPRLPRRAKLVRLPDSESPETAPELSQASRSWITALLAILGLCGTFWLTTRGRLVLQPS
jgi:hypothetical protein